VLSGLSVGSWSADENTHEQIIGRFSRRNPRNRWLGWRSGRLPCFRCETWREKCLTTKSVPIRIAVVQSPRARSSAAHNAKPWKRLPTSTANAVSRAAKAAPLDLRKKTEQVRTSTTSPALLFRNLCSLFAGFREPDGNCLLPAGDFASLAAFARTQRASFPSAHRAAYPFL